MVADRIQCLNPDSKAHLRLRQEESVSLGGCTNTPPQQRQQGQVPRSRASPDYFSAPQPPSFPISISGSSIFPVASAETQSAPAPELFCLSHTKVGAWALPSPIEPDSSLPQHPCPMALASDSRSAAPALSLHSTGRP